MMDPKEELAALRRLAELEARASGDPEDMSFLAGLKKAGKELGRGTGMALRSAAQGITAPAQIITDAATGLANQVLPEGWRLNTSGHALNQMLDKIGLGAPATAGERFLSDVVSAGTGAGALNAAAKASPSAMMRLLDTGNKGVTAAMSGGAAASGARELGGGPVVQFGAGLVGGLLPTAASVGLRGVLPHATEAGRQDAIGRMLNQAADPQRAGVLNALDRTRPTVPGEQLTTARATTEAGAPTIQAIEKLVVNRYRPDLAHAVTEGNSTARLDSLRTIGKDESTLNAALLARSNIGGKAYQRAVDEGIDPALAQALKPMRDSLLRRPEIQAAKADAVAIAKGDDVVLTDAYSVQGLGYMKRALQRDLDSAIVSGDTDKTRVLKNTVKDLTDYLENVSPASRQADRVFQRLSREPNRMQLGQALEGRLTDALTDLEKRNPRMFATGLQNLDDLAKKETGFPVNLRPDQRNTLSGISTSLEREANSRGMANLGTGRAGDIVGQELKPGEIPGILHRAVTVARFALEHVGIATKNMTLREMAAHIQDPATAARLMRDATPGQIAAMKQVAQAGMRPASTGLLQTLPRIEQRGLLDPQEE